MAFWNMAGFEVMPERPSSSTNFFNFPDRIKLPLKRSSQTLCPNASNRISGFIPLPPNRWYITLSLDHSNGTQTGNLVCQAGAVYHFDHLVHVLICLGNFLQQAFT